MFQQKIEINASQDRVVAEHSHREGNWFIQDDFLWLYLFDGRNILNRYIVEACMPNWFDNFIDKKRINIIYNLREFSGKLAIGVNILEINGCVSSKLKARLPDCAFEILKEYKKNQDISATFVI